MSKKRERLEIIHDILKAILDKGNSARPTHILYKSNLSHQMLTEYLTELIAKGFLVEKSDKRMSKQYELTDKGFKYLQEYKIITNFISSYGLE